MATTTATTTTTTATTTTTTTGLRQGCTGSPILWAAVTALLCATIDAQIHEGWVQSHLTLYADDSHLRWRFKSGAEFENLMNKLRIVFACFRKFHPPSDQPRENQGHTQDYGPHEAPYTPTLRSQESDRPTTSPYAGRPFSMDLFGITGRVLGVDYFV